MPLDSPPLPNDDNFDNENARRNMDDLGLSNVAGDEINKKQKEVSRSFADLNRGIKEIRQQVMKAFDTFREMVANDAKITTEDAELYRASLVAFDDMIADLQENHTEVERELEEIASFRDEFKASVRKRLAQTDTQLDG